VREERREEKIEERRREVREERMIT